MLTNEIKAIFFADSHETVLIYTVGNKDRGDDGVGPYIAENLPGNLEGLIIKNAGLRPENLLFDMHPEKPARVLIIDAADFGGKTGEARLFSVDCIPENTLSTHTFPLSVIASLIIKDLKTEVVFLGIQAGTFEFGSPLSKNVKKTADEIIALISGIKAIQQDSPSI